MKKVIGDEKLKSLSYIQQSFVFKSTEKKEESKFSHTLTITSLSLFFWLFFLSCFLHIGIILFFIISRCSFRLIYLSHLPSLCHLRWLPLKSHLKHSHLYSLLCTGPSTSSLSFPLPTCYFLYCPHFLFFLFFCIIILLPSLARPFSLPLLAAWQQPNWDDRPECPWAVVSIHGGGPPQSSGRGQQRETQVP